MYDELAKYISKVYGLTQDVFNINLESATLEASDQDIDFYETENTGNSSIFRYRYKKARTARWSSIELFISPGAELAVAETLNGFFKKHDLDIIDLRKLKTSVDNGGDFEHRLTDEQFGFFVFSKGFFHSIIDMSKDQRDL